MPTPICNLKPNCLLVFIVAFYSVHTFSQENIFFSGAREAALANTGVAYSQEWAMFHNPGRLSENIAPVIGAHYTNQYMLSELSVASITAIMPTGKGSFGAATSYFGTAGYNEQKYALGYSHGLGKNISVGISANYISVHLPEGYEPEGALIGEIGLSAYPVEKLAIGCCLYNVTGSKFKNYTSENAPSFFSLGCAWEDETFMLTSEAKLIKNENPEISAAAEMFLVPNLALRIGASTCNMYQYTFGLGYAIKFFNCDLAFARHPVLGFSSFLSIHYTFQKG